MTQLTYSRESFLPTCTVLSIRGQTLVKHPSTVNNLKKHLPQIPIQRHKTLLLLLILLYSWKLSVVAASSSRFLFFVGHNLGCSKKEQVLGSSRTKGLCTRNGPNQLLPLPFSPDVKSGSGEGGGAGYPPHSSHDCQLFQHVPGVQL